MIALAVQRHALALLCLASLQQSLAQSLLFGDNGGLETRPAYATQEGGHVEVQSVDNIPAYELQALQDIFDATDGDGWTWNSALGNRWNFTVDANPCTGSWQGITCDETSSPYHVTNLVLVKTNLHGTLPESLGQLSKLSHIDLGSNLLYETLPESLANCTGLKTLGLSYNHLFDEMPDMTAWPLLEVVDLGTNHFTGTISPHHCDLHHLVVYILTNNFLNGEIPDCFGSLVNLQQFKVDENYLVGPLPLSLANLTAMLELYLFTNLLTGCIPAEYSSLVNLETITLGGNKLTGTIPDTFRSLTKLSNFVFSQNLLTGTLPEYLSTLSQLTFIDVSDNAMNGTIHNSLGSLALLQRLYLFSNSFTGTIPASLGNCAPMWYIDVSKNKLSGKIPSALARLSKMQDLELYDNMLSGPIPEIFGNMTQLSSVYMLNNALTGPLPSSLSNCSALSVFETGNNMLTGSIPSAFFDNFEVMIYFDVSYNLMTGVIPANVGRVYTMEYFNLFHNHFTGHIPVTVGDHTYLQYIFLGLNSFSGTIPSIFQNLYYLEQVDFDCNYFTGMIPADLGSVPFLQFLDAETNMLTGTVPSTFSQAEYLIDLVINNNHLTGPLDQMFNASMQVELVTVVLNNNRFSGTLPSEPFRLSKLNSFSVVSNCFHGQLPLIICNCTTLVTLALDGLSSALTCRNALLPRISGSYLTTRPISGTVPECFYHLPKLTTLHLSGNGLTGSLPAESINPFLVDLSLSHNVLTGTIPLHMQVRPWYNLDLSYNRLTGTLSSAFQTESLNSTYFKHLSDLVGRNISARNAESSLSLENNRLSGPIPSSVHSKANVSILGSNLFTCNLEKSNLPRHDPGRDNYQCDSQEFNLPFYMWLSLLGSCVAALLLVWRYQEKVGVFFGVDHAYEKVMKWYHVLDAHKDLLNPKRRLRAYQTVLYLSDGILTAALHSTVYVLFVMLPVLTATTAYYGTFTHQYAWSVSAAYTSGVTPAALVMTVMIGLMILTTTSYAQQVLKFAATPRTVNRYASTDTRSSIVPHRTGVLPVLQVVLIYTAFIAITVTVVVGANVAYVYVAIYGKSDVLLIAQLALSLFKLSWNRYFSILLIRWTARQLAASRSDGTAAVDEANPPELQLVSLQVFVALLNNIAIPCLVVAVISPSCFYNVFVSAPKISTVYTYQECALIDGADCVAFEVDNIHTDYPPPFTYSYQCSSSFITYYAPAFVWLCMMRTFLTPVVQYTLYTLHRRAMTRPDSNWFKIIDGVTPENLKPIDAATEATIHPSVYSPYFDANQLVLSLITYMGLLLTFGAVFPPVAIALLVTLASVVYFNKLKLGWFLSSAAEKGLFAYVDLIEAESRRSGFQPVLARTLWMLVTVSCWFYTLFLFDTLGDEVGFKGAYWVLLVMPTMPVVLYILYEIVMLRTTRGARELSAASGVSIETASDVESECNSGVIMNILRESTASSEVSASGNTL